MGSKDFSLVTKTTLNCSFKENIFKRDIQVLKKDIKIDMMSVT